MLFEVSGWLFLRNWLLKPSWTEIFLAHRLGTDVNMRRRVDTDNPCSWSARAEEAIA